MKSNYRVTYYEEMQLFKVRLFSDVEESTVQACFHSYETLVEKYHVASDFKLIINNSYYKPSSEQTHQLIRKLFSNQKHKYKCIKVAIVNESIPAASVAKIEGFFPNEKEALEWLCKSNIIG